MGNYSICTIQNKKDNTALVNEDEKDYGKMKIVQDLNELNKKYITESEIKKK